MPPSAPFGWCPNTTRIFRATRSTTCTIKAHLIPLVAHDLFDAIAVRQHGLDLLGRLNQRLPTRRDVAVVGVLHGQADDRTGVQIDGLFRFVRQVRSPVLHLGDFGIGLVRMHPVDSWKGAFSYVVEGTAAGVIGLRPPQIGAVHAGHAHCPVAESQATVVMPTGTGKTETMLSILVSACCLRVLVIVPTDALRTQIAEKFLTLGHIQLPDVRIEDQMPERP